MKIVELRKCRPNQLYFNGIYKDQSRRDIHANNDKNNTENPSDDVTNVTNVTRSQVHTIINERNSLQDNNSSENTEDKDVTRAHRAHRSHNKTTIVQINHTDSDATKKVILDIWPETNLNKIVSKIEANESLESITTSDTSDTSDLLTPKLDLKHTQEPADFSTCQMRI